MGPRGASRSHVQTRGDTWGLAGPRATTRSLEGGPERHGATSALARLLRQAALGRGVCVPGRCVAARGTAHGVCPRRTTGAAHLGPRVLGAAECEERAPDGHLEKVHIRARRDVPIPGYMDVWARIHGCMDIWINGQMHVGVVIWICGYMGLWLYGYMAICVHG